MRSLQRSEGSAGSKDGDLIRAYTRRGCDLLSELRAGRSALLNTSLCASVPLHHSLLHAVQHIGRCVTDVIHQPCPHTALSHTSALPTQYARPPRPLLPQRSTRPSNPTCCSQCSTRMTRGAPDRPPAVGGRLLCCAVTYSSVSNITDTYAAQGSRSSSETRAGDDGSVTRRLPGTSRRSGLAGSQF